MLWMGEQVKSICKFAPLLLLFNKAAIAQKQIFKIPSSLLTYPLIILIPQNCSKLHLYIKFMHFSIYYNIRLLKLSYLSYDVLHVFPILLPSLTEIRLGGFEVLNIFIIGYFGLDFIGVFIILYFFYFRLHIRPHVHYWLTTRHTYVLFYSYTICIIFL